MCVFSKKEKKDHKILNKERKKSQRKKKKKKNSELKIKKKMCPSKFILPSFSKKTPKKISKTIDVSGQKTVIKTKGFADWSAAIADELIDAKLDGQTVLCVRVDNMGAMANVMIGFTPMETFDSSKKAHFGWNGFTGAGLLCLDGFVYPVTRERIIDREISEKATEIIAILTTIENGKKKEIRFICDGVASEPSVVSEHLEGDCVWPVICLCFQSQQVTAIPIGQIEIRTPAVENLIKEFQSQENVEIKKENEKEKKAQQVATKKSKKESENTTVATKKKDETKNGKEKKTKANK